jgi:hypothetical protein
MNKVISYLIGLLIFSEALAGCSQTVEIPSRKWKAVPEHKGVFVDMSSIRRVPVIPARDEYHLKGHDTEADIKVGNYILRGNMFYCDDPEVMLGDATFGTIPSSNESGVIPNEAARPIVCSN